MSKNLVTGYPRIGEHRELKFALESFWGGKSDFQAVEDVAKSLRAKAWITQKNAGVDIISSNDFSYYDQMLDTMILVGAVPARFKSIDDKTAKYFAMARGYENGVAMAMRKWFNTNYHYIIPELTGDEVFKLDSTKVINEYKEAAALGIKTKINLISPITFLALSVTTDGSDQFLLFDKLLRVYEELFIQIGKLDDEIIVQLDDAIFAIDIEPKLLSLIKPCYDRLCNVSSNIKVIATTYFEHSNEATKVLVLTQIWGLGLDFVAGAKNIESLEEIAKSDKVLAAGVINGRNVWKNDILKTKELLEKISTTISKERLIVSTSCSLLHVPYSLENEDKLDNTIKDSLSFANEKLNELTITSRIFFGISNDEDDEKLKENGASINKLKNSKLIHNEAVQDRVNKISKWSRDGEFDERIVLQKAKLGYPDLATTTIGSFPQTPELRITRRDFKNGKISHEEYEVFIKNYIRETIAIQERIGLDVLVHGEPERNDMVEYFGELLDGFAFSSNGWVQSYGARCVKPPLLYGDVSREVPMTLQWILYAQSLTSKIVKGMLTGPVTMINWSFVREDIPRSEVATQIALALADEIDDLQSNGIKIIQVDEAAFKEGYPLRDENRASYEKWAVDSFKLSVSSAYKETQIHTHMCYSEFNDIIHTIEDMDADVITIETAKSGNSLLKIFKKVGYTKEVGPGVYDIHSPRIPTVEEIKTQITLLLEVLPKEQLWINPDCGLKTRKWEEVIPSLENMVKAAISFR
ncbi:MAG: 5-methyltetrahydropteroyltriglutamate--homocysteine S-methyltransferase [Sulfurovaceae bacterium]|nr:5-methyltetrahydropteroyltriglutamate--homocysteine S-methyltransferase [Sulfurovaceae bacterium]